MVICNHVDFCDPHVLFALGQQLRLYPRWLIGIEAFEKMNGLFAWHLCSCGGFSIDRGRPDRRSLARVQSALADSARPERGGPLMVFPEGEANYTGDVLYPFQEGVAQFALKSEAAQETMILPLLIRYEFTDSPWREFFKALERLNRRLESRARVLGRLPLPREIQRPFSGNGKPWEDEQKRAQQALIQTCHYAFWDLGLHYSGQSSQPEAVSVVRDWLEVPDLLETMIDELIGRILTPLCVEHDPALLSGLEESPLAYETVLRLKNKLRSRIAEKYYALSSRELSWLRTARQRLENPYGFWNARLLGLMETALLGWRDEDQPLDKRLVQIDRCLERHRALSRSNPADCSGLKKQWKAQMNDCRRVKLLKLLQADLRRIKEAGGPEEVVVSWETLDEMLRKLEALLFGSFRYRGPKVARLAALSPLQLSDWVERHRDIPERQRPRHLVDELHVAMESHLQEWTGQLNPVDGRGSVEENVPVVSY